MRPFIGDTDVGMPVFVDGGVEGVGADPQAVGKRETVFVERANYVVEFEFGVAGPWYPARRLANGIGDLAER